jgi:tetratricopeptide (TPR) repeat protein
LVKKDSYYYSVDPERLTAVRDKVTGWFDVDYCVKKAQAVANQKDMDPDTLDYGLHLAKLARVVKPDSHAAQLAEAQLLLRKGERDEALRMLEDIREAKRGSGEEEDAWFIANRVLGMLYLDELNRPDLAINCFNDYREYQRSGADTIYDLGRAYEAKGDKAAAIKSYELVTAYQNHPRYWDATEAVRRLKEGG